MAFQPARELIGYICKDEKGEWYIGHLRHALEYGPDELIGFDPADAHALLYQNVEDGRLECKMVKPANKKTVVTEEVVKENGCHHLNTIVHVLPGCTSSDIIAAVYSIKPNNRDNLTWRMTAEAYASLVPLLKWPQWKLLGHPVEFVREASIYGHEEHTACPDPDGSLLGSDSNS